MPSVHPFQATKSRTDGRINQWRRSGVKYEGQGQSDQAIKLFQIIPYVSDF